MSILTFIRHVQHRLFCYPKDSFYETAPGEVFLRCMNCGLRSPGMTTGPLRLASALPGDPSRHRLTRKLPVVPMTQAEVDVAVEVFEVIEERTPRLSGRVH